MINNQQANEKNPSEATEKTALLPKGSLLAKCRVIIITSMGQAGVYYNVSVVGFLVALLESSLSPGAEGVIASVLLIGVLCGQVIFGPLTDLLGPKLAGLASASCAILGVCIATSADLFLPLEVQLVVGRFILGIGAGGEYPVAASFAISMKQNIVEQRSLLLATSVIGYASQGLMFLIIFPAPFLNVPTHVVWRCLLAVGGLPSVLCLFFRLRLDPTELKTVPQIESYGCELSESLKGKKLQFFGFCVSWSLFTLCTSSLLAFGVVIVQDMLAITEFSTASSADVLLMTLPGLLNWMMGLGLFFFLKRIVDYMTLTIFAMTFTLISALTICSWAISFQHAWVGLGLFSATVTGVTSNFASTSFYAIVAEMFGAETVGFYVGVAVVCVKVCASLSLFLCPILMDHFGTAVVLLMLSMCMFGSTLSMMLCVPGGQGHAKDATEEHLA